MKDATLKGRKKRAEEKVLSTYFLYLDKYGFGDLYLKRRAEIALLSSKKDRNAFLDRYKKELALLLQKKCIPYHWISTFYDMLDKSKINLPVHQTIFLSVGPYQIINGDYDEETIRKSGASEVSIHISGKTKRNQLREFIELNADLIAKLQALIHLKDIKLPRLDNFVDGYVSLLEMETKKTVREITEKKGDHANLTKTTQKTIDRYKKYFTPEK